MKVAFYQSTPKALPKHSQSIPKASKVRFYRLVEEGAKALPKQLRRTIEKLKLESSRAA